MGKSIASAINYEVKKLSRKIANLEKNDLLDVVESLKTLQLDVFEMTGDYTVKNVYKEIMKQTDLSDERKKMMLGNYLKDLRKANADEKFTVKGAKKYIKSFAEENKISEVSAKLEIEKNVQEKEIEIKYEYMTNLIEQGKGEEYIKALDALGYDIEDELF